MRISLSGLRSGPQTFAQRFPAHQYLNDTITFPEDLFVQAILEKESNVLRLDLTTRIMGHFNCDRCVATFVKEHSCQETFFYTFSDSDKIPHDADIALIPKNAIELDISQEIRDLVILGLPYQFLCRSDCKGLCINCGADLNVESCSCARETVDPRWEALLKLKANKIT